MARIATALVCGGWFLCVGQGCTHFIETRTIEHFTRALQDEDLTGLKSTTSSQFERMALRLEESVEDFRTLRLPKGEVSIVDVEDVSDHEKLVTVTAGKSKRKLRYHLTRDAETKKWVVDDILVRQKQEGLNVTRSVTEQMDLLLTVREFLAAWDQGERDEALAVTTPEFRNVLQELPPVYFARLTRQVVGDESRSSQLRPEAHLDGDVATVIVSRSRGKLVFSFRLQDGLWKVGDLAVESKGDRDHIPSVLKMATVMNAAVSFLDSYGAGDRQTLSRVCTEKFYTAGLAPADFSTVELPDAQLSHNNYQIKMEGRRAEFVVEGETDIVKISMIRDKEAGESESPDEYLVEEVTVYELDGTQEKRLSSLFTAHAMLEIFSESLARNDLAMLRKTSTTDLNNRIWNRLDEITVRRLPFDDLRHSTPRVVSTVFQGAVTEITAIQGARAVTYVLRERAGEVRVDDVLVPVPGRPTSLKETVELLMPLQAFAAGIHSSRIDLLTRTSSEDFNRLVWNQANEIPDIGFAVQKHLEAPLTSIETGTDHVMITLGDDRWGAKVLLVEAHGRHVVDEVQLIAGPEPKERTEMKQAMRMRMARGGISSRGGDRPRRSEPPTEAEDASLRPPDPSDTAFQPPSEEPERFE